MKIMGIRKSPIWRNDMTEDKYEKRIKHRETISRAKALVEKKKYKIPMITDEETKEIQFPDAVIRDSLLTEEESAFAHNTSLHSLRLMEALLMSGTLNKIEVIGLLKILAEYQFLKAGARKAPDTEKNVVDLLKELDNEES
jgi:hypothetical protein